MKNYIYYTYYDKKKECKAVKAVTTYDGKAVVGHAYVHPSDTYDEEFGKQLAGMRCQRKILKRKLANSKQRIRDDSQYLIYLLERVEEIKKDIEKSEYIKRETEASLKAIEVALVDIAQTV